MASSAPQKPLSLMPREHGAYAQLGVSLLAALALVPLSGRAWVQAMATVLVFLLSEPFLVLRGRRGEALRRSGAREARRRIGFYLALLFPALALAWREASPLQGASILPGLMLGLALLGLFLARREHSAPGELLASAAFSCAALPVTLLGGAKPAQALTLALGLTALHGLGTLLVRGFLTSQKHALARGPRALPALLGLGLTAGWLASPLPWPMALAFIPLTAAAFWVWVTPPSPRDLRTVGWVLTAGSAAGALVLLASMP